jgi:hypothetical protein
MALEADGCHGEIPATSDFLTSLSRVMIRAHETISASVIEDTAWNTTPISHGPWGTNVALSSPISPHSCVLESLCSRVLFTYILGLLPMKSPRHRRVARIWMEAQTLASSTPAIAEQCSNRRLWRFPSVANIRVYSCPFVVHSFFFSVVRVFRGQ